MIVAFSSPGHDLDVAAKAPRYADWGAAVEYGAGVEAIAQKVLSHVALLDIVETVSQLRKTPVGGGYLLPYVPAIAQNPEEPLASKQVLKKSA